MVTYNIHAGHGISGGQGCGAIGILDESKEARNVKNKLIDILRKHGDTVYDCTFEGSASWYIQDLVRFTFYKAKLKSTSSYDSGVYSYCAYNLSGSDYWLGTSGETTLVGISTSINDLTISNRVVERTITLKLTLGSYGWFNIEYNSSKYKVTIV